MTELLPQELAIQKALDEGDLMQFKAIAEQYNLLPPLWIVRPHIHPVSIGWRMRYGEEYKIIWFEWWKAQEYEEAEAVAYFHRFEPPHAWLQWVIFKIWPDAWKVFSDALNSGAGQANETIRPYFERLEKLGFGSFDDWHKDYERKGWK